MHIFSILIGIHGFMDRYTNLFQTSLFMHFKYVLVLCLLNMGWTVNNWQLFILKDFFSHGNYFKFSFMWKPERQRDLQRLVHSPHAITARPGQTNTRMLKLNPHLPRGRRGLPLKICNSRKQRWGMGPGLEFKHSHKGVSIGGSRALSLREGGK